MVLILDLSFYEAILGLFGGMNFNACQMQFIIENVNIL